MMKNRIKVQGSRLKAQGPRFSSCTLCLVPCCQHHHSSAFQRGFSLISAIFLLVVIAALGAFAVTLSTTQQQSAGLDVVGARAYQAARAGIEWGAYRVLRGGACPVSPSGVAGLPNTLASFTVTVTCDGVATTEDGVPVILYQVTSTATQGGVGTSNYAERQISVSIAN